MARWLSELSELCAEPSVSSAGIPIERCALVVTRLLEARGFRVTVVKSQYHPTVLAEIGTGDRRMIFYNHYDVQPPGPMDLWDTPPFEASVRDERFFARGAVDNKGDLIVRLAGIDAYLALHGPLPFRVAFLIEGEEEIGSPGLERVIETNGHLIVSDGCIWEAGGVDDDDVPSAVLGVRGHLSIELSTVTANSDVHSGERSYMPNAAWRLVWALNTLKSPDERVLIDGFYDNVKQPSARQQELFAALPSREQQVRDEFGVEVFAGGLTGSDWADYLRSPTCTINGLTSGFQDDGQMMIIPARAMAKLDFRLLPGQHPEEVLSKLRCHLDAHGFADITIKSAGGSSSAASDPDHPFVRLFADAVRETYGCDPILYPYAGGSGPAELFLRTVTPSMIDVGLVYGGCRAHAPNENFRLRDFRLTAELVFRILEGFAAEGGRGRSMAL